jgi:hypothetical protein
MKINGLLLRAAILASIFCVTAHASRLHVTFAADASICDGFRKSFSGFDTCVIDDDCFLSSTLADDVGRGLTRVSFEQIAVNQYGYTEVYVAKPPGRSYSLVFLNRFQGDNHPRLLETWKVDTLALQSLIAREPHPLRYDEWVKGGHGITRETLAPEFSQILARGDKISDDRAPVQMPVFSGSQGDYAASRECVGEWQFGGEYRCTSVVKVAVKRVDGPKIVPVCEVSRQEAEAAVPH